MNTTNPTNISEAFVSDIPLTAAIGAFDRVSHFPERRAESTRSEYAAQLTSDYEMLRAEAKKGGTVALLETEFARYREGYRTRYRAYLASSARCASWFIVGPSGYPAARMQKRADICHKRLNEVFEFRTRALSAIRRTLRPDLRPIYASDANAIERLEAEIDRAEAKQQRMKAANLAMRQNAKDGPEAQVAALLVLGFPEAIARKLLEPDFCGRKGFADFELTNNGANIRRMKARLAHILELRATPSTEAEGTHARIEDCPPDNRIRLFFPGKPDEGVRAELKRNGFRWTPSLGCWQAYRNWHAIETAKRIAGLGQKASTAA